jgi:hypothetical protein
LKLASYMWLAAGALQAQEVSEKQPEKSADDLIRSRGGSMQDWRLRARLGATDNEQGKAHTLAIELKNVSSAPKWYWPAAEPFSQFEISVTRDGKDVRKLPPNGPHPLLDLAITIKGSHGKEVAPGEAALVNLSLDDRFDLTAPGNYEITVRQRGRLEFFQEGGVSRVRRPMGPPFVALWSRLSERGQGQPEKRDGK